jgi:hypothetical protein
MLNLSLRLFLNLLPQCVNFLNLISQLALFLLGPILLLKVHLSVA